MDERDVGSVDNSLARVFRHLDESEDTGSRNELLQMQRIRELDMEPLEEEEDDSEADNPNSSRFLNQYLHLCFDSSRFAQPGRRWNLCRCDSIALGSCCVRDLCYLKISVEACQCE